ncbi:MAG: DUF2971 domain-containing protein [Desulfovibrionaceae bacterium]|nr:DUF2971 domain-containing protein [Desulfovibrionaceae bacterium]
MPDAYFKYYAADSLKLTLSNTTRKWSSPFEFNDPFDNRLDIQWTGDPTDIEISMKKQIIQLVEDECADLDLLPSDLRTSISAIRTMLPAERSAFLKSLKELEGTTHTQATLNAMHVELNRDIELLLSDTSIFCLTEDHDNLLMWAHYADSHKGGVVKFLPVKEVDSPLLVARQVIYSRSAPAMEYTNILDIDNTEELKEAIIDAVTLTKSIDWQYEKEWRIVTRLRGRANNHDILPFAKEEVGGLYLGCRISEADRSELIEIMAEKYPWAPIYQATPKRNEFSLAFEQIYGP